MGYKTENIILLWEEDEMFTVQQLIKQYFPLMQMKKYAGDFTALVAQVNGISLCHQAYRDGNWQQFGVSDEDELWDLLYSIPDQMTAFSEKIGSRKVVFISVDCFGGVCRYEGSVSKSGRIEFRQEMSPDGHISLLRHLWSDYKTHYFEPFTRDFFLKKAKINGWIQQFTIAGLWAVLRMDYPDRKTYYIDANRQALIFRKDQTFYFYFEQLEDGNIQVSGSIYQEYELIFVQLNQLIGGSFQGMNYHVQIQFLERGEIIHFSNPLK